MSTVAAYRRGYTEGWAWGLVCGIVCGCCTTGLAVLLVIQAKRALGL